MNQEAFHLVLEGHSRGQEQRKAEGFYRKRGGVRKSLLKKKKKRIIWGQDNFFLEGRDPRVLSCDSLFFLWCGVREKAHVLPQCRQFSHSVVSDSLRPPGLQHARPPCPSPTPGAYSNSCPLSRWCHLILCCPLLLPTSVFPRIRIFSNESVLCIRWPKY